MKKIVILFVVMLFATFLTYGQTTIKQGNKVVKTVADSASRKGGKSTDTGFTLEKGGKTYPIMMSNSGRCYIEKVSSKTGKTYKDYASVDKTEPWTYIKGAKQPTPKSK